MPLSQNTKTESKSIEDLIAQLDAPSTVEKVDGMDAGASENRKVIRGKRTTSTSSTGGNTNSNNTGSAAAGSGNGQSSTAYYDPVLQKNIIISKKYSKALRTTKGRGLPKKGGGGGNYTWGAPGCELMNSSVDPNDPNYDSEDAGNVVMVCMENETASRTDSDTGGYHTASSTVQQTLEIDDFDREIKPVILEYFQNGDTVEVVDQLKCYNFSKIKPQLLSYIIQIALEQNSTCKELTSRLLRDFHFELFSTNDFEKCFDNLIKNLNDLELDNPDAAKTIGIFIARCIADKCLTIDYLKKYNSNDDPLSTKVQVIVDQAKLLTNMNDHLFHLSHIWGHNQGGFTAVKDLTDKISALIQEYYDSGDRDEAIRCLKELNVPHFNHEFVYEALDFVLQKGDDHSIDLITNLFKSLYESVIVTHDQMKKGFIRIYDLLPDISLDVPAAYNLIEKVIDICQSKGIIGNDIADLAPNRSRKRFVSEGDGGRVKDANVQ